jgi:transcriptional regulator with XRE-family HTH domain
LGRSFRPIPKGLPEKLYYIRLSLKLTQKQMLERLRIGLDKDLDPINPPYPSHISEYERGIREPPLRVLVEYARVAVVPMDVLVDRWLQIRGEGGLFIRASFIEDAKKEAALRRLETSKKRLTPSKKAKSNKPSKRKPK